MQSDFNATIAKNASANLIRLLGSGIVALLLPAFLARKLSHEAFGTWALLLQWTVYISFLDLGVQTAVARFVAHATELDKTDQRNGIASTAVAVLTAAAAVGLILVAVASWQLPRIFPQMPSYLFRDAQVAFMLMGGSLAIGLPVYVLHAVFVGMQRNELPMAITLVNRACMAGLVVVCTIEHLGLRAMGAAVAIANLVSYAIAYIAWKRVAPHVKIRRRFAQSTYFTQMAGYSGATVVWLVAMLMISGLDLTIVGIFDYSATAYYAVAATLTNFVAQAQGAIFSALLPASAVLAARGDEKGLGVILIASTRYGMLILLAMALPLVLAGNWVLATWLGKSYASQSTLIFQVLLVANVIRLCPLPYATLLLGTGQQRKVILSPLAEGMANVAASVLGAYLFGALGVAIGTLIGSFVSVGFHFFYNMPRTSLILIDRILLIRQGLLRPLLCAVPLLTIVLFRGKIPMLSSGVSVLLWFGALMGTALLFWNFGLVPYERQKLGQVLGIS